MLYQWFRDDRSLSPPGDGPQYLLRVLNRDGAHVVDIGALCASHRELCDSAGDRWVLTRERGQSPVSRRNVPEEWRTALERYARTFEF